MKRVPPDIERSVLRALSQAAKAAMESPVHPNAEPRESRALTAAWLVLDALSRGDTEAARQAISEYASG